MSSWDAAREFCESKNSTLPIIRDENIDRVFHQFLDDSYDVIQNRSVWLNARPVNDSVGWHWINGSQSGIENTYEEPSFSSLSFSLCQIPHLPCCSLLKFV